HALAEVSACQNRSTFSAGESNARPRIFEKSAHPAFSAPRFQAPARIALRPGDEWVPAAPIFPLFLVRSFVFLPGVSYFFAWRGEGSAGRKLGSDRPPAFGRPLPAPPLRLIPRALPAKECSISAMKSE